MVRHETSGTLDEALLVRYLHDELDAETAAAVRAHVADCDVCRAALDGMEHSARRVSEALRAVDFSPPPASEWQAVLDAARARRVPRSTAVRYRNAAGWILLLTAGAVLASSPVRGWIAQRWTDLTATSTAETEAPAAPAEGHAALAFEPDGPALDILLATLQSGGVLALRFGDGTTAEVTVRDGATEQLAVGGNTLRIANDSAAASSYEIVLPMTVERLRVRIGDADPLTLERTNGDVEIALATGRPVRNPPARDENR